MSYQLSEEEQKIVSEEDQILKDVLLSLENQRTHYGKRSKIESARARDLTSRLVATRRAEDRALMASDEWVSHTLEQKNQNEIKGLDKLIKKPYFARIILEEERPDGTIKEIEYKLGSRANPDCRIIDWRKAPISKLYYEYKEGDEYSEQIQGIERNGTVRLRNSLEIEDSELNRITCRYGNFIKQGDSWIKSNSSRGSLTEKARGELPPILALITAEQFQTITEDAKTAILIQGIAGSGKTTVALHRLAWLLEPENSDLKAEHSLVVVLTLSLKTYIANSLKSLGIEGIIVRTLSEWSEHILRYIAPNFVSESNRVIRPAETCPHSIERVKRSMALLNCIEEYPKGERGQFDYYQALEEILRKPDQIIAHDETKLLDRDLIKATLDRSLKNKELGALDWCDDSLCIRLYEHQRDSVPLENGTPGKYKHLLVDEVQDLSPIDLAALIGVVERSDQLTIVGDISQSLNRVHAFPGWDRLRKFWDLKDSVAKFFELTISHRSTLQIMKLADHIKGRSEVTQGRGGRIPIWFRCTNETKGIEACINWLSSALERYPSALTAVVCSDEREARFALSLLKPRFGESARLGSNDGFSFDAGIIVTDIKQVKGLEFMNVLLWNPSEKSYPSEESLSRNRLYVAITRAEENLAIVTWNKPSNLLPHIKSPLIRGFIVSSEEEE